MPDRTDTAPPVPTPAALAAHLEALNLAGVAFAAKRLLGKDATPVTAQFGMWARGGKPGLPALTEAYWRALSPLRIGRPSSTAAAVCDQVLVGREPDSAVAQQATADGAAEGKARFKAAQLPDMAGDSRADVLRQRALVNAVKEYWRTLGAVYTDVRDDVVAGDLEGSVYLLRSRERTLRELVEQVAVLAAGVAGAAPVDVPDATPAAQPDPVRPAMADAAADPIVALPDDGPGPMTGAAATPAPAPVDTTPPVEIGPHAEEPAASPPTVVDPGPLRLTDEQAQAFARRGEVRQPEPEPRRPVEVLSSKPVRNHPFLPIVFLLVVSGVALFVLYTIINDPTNPLVS